LYVWSVKTAETSAKREDDVKLKEANSKIASAVFVPFE
jgi:hypothetical protein